MTWFRNNLRGNNKNDKTKGITEMKKVINILLPSLQEEPTTEYVTV